MTQTRSHMAAEIAETPEAVARFLDREMTGIKEIGRRLRTLDPAVIVTCARGSSDHAAAFFKYLVEIHLGIPVASIGPSVASIYQAPLRLRSAAVVSVSQSGQSPDIVALQAAARRAGALALAVVNQAGSPLSTEADITLLLHAGEEKSVAATKSCIASAVALAAVVAEWSGNAALRDAVLSLPETLHAALSCDWSAALPAFQAAQSAYVVARGPALPVAAEAALKLKETAVLHAEAFSAAEVMHGPLQLLEPGFPVLVFRQRDAAAPGIDQAVSRLRAVKGRVFVASMDVGGLDALPSVATGHGSLDPLAMLLSFYTLAEQVARARGYDPDRPSHLRKVTETV